MVSTNTILLVGSSVDGKVTLSATSSSKEFGKILKPEMNSPIIKLRRWADAIITSSNTVLLDNPTMNLNKPNSYRCVIDRSLKLPRNKKFFDGSCPTIVFCLSDKCDKNKLLELEKKNLEIIPLKAESFFTDLKKNLQKRGIKNILFEGGGNFNSVLLKNKVIDKLVIAYFPFLIGGKNTPTIFDGDSSKDISDAIRLDLTSSEKIHGMIVNTYTVNKSI